MIDFEDPDLAVKAEAMTTEELDALPFGAIRLDEDLRVIFHSAAEKRLSGFVARPTEGRLFFADIAPCMDAPAFRGRIEAARRAGEVDIEFGFVGDFADDDRELRVRVLSGSVSTLWVFMARED